MNRKILGIIPNELEIKLPPFISLCYDHLEKILEFIYNTGINLYDKENSDIDTISKLLAEQGYLIFSVDETENAKWMIIYIPEKVSQNQLNYFEKRKNNFKEYAIEYLTKQSDDTFKSKYQENIEKSIIDSLIDDLTNRLTTKEKNKTLIREKNNQ